MNNYLQLVQVAQECGPFEDMAKFMEQLIKEKKTDLTQQEKSFFSEAFKQLIGNKRKSLRNIKGYEIFCKDEQNTELIPSILTYKKIVEDDLVKKCQNIISLIDNYLLKKAENDESFLLYYKSKADYYRYIAENSAGPLKQKACQEAINAYKEATNYSKKIGKINPTALGNSLNFSIFYDEIMKDQTNAKNIATDAYEKAQEEISKINQNDENYAEITDIINCLKENIDSWK